MKGGHGAYQEPRAEQREMGERKPAGAKGRIPPSTERGPPSPGSPRCTHGSAAPQSHLPGARSPLEEEKLSHLEDDINAF